ncbi:tumor necrosis factor receptor superfamily member 10B-like [Molothrus ater]|uniref:tumor necrosis factor receptor superfamily member 10B-like n=1 Tax=Molothrus ater TaxID=84834 RepID=UPI00174EB015|nr:tumor necrosis factor receptor superfamily member 10B-like [Molothrus ater]
MGAVMGAGRAAGLLLLVVLLTMPRARANCGEREYFHQGLCCVFCEAGTFVADHCNASHLKGKCDPCKQGKGFTAHANGLEECLPCRQCKEDQITLRPCTLTQNAECQCKQGYFCDYEDCEMCRRISQEKLTIANHARIMPILCVYACSIHGSELCLEKNRAWTELCTDLEMLIQCSVTLHFRHPDGKEILLNSTDTTELGLTNQGKEARVWVIPVLLMAGLGLLIVVVVLVRKLKCDKAASAVKDVEGHLISARMCSCDATSCDSCKVREPSQIIVKDLSQRELRETFDVFTKEVPPQQWKQLMRTLLQENDIDKIISKFPNNRDEQSYQMLLIWKKTLGKEQCINNLLDALKHIDTKAYYSVLNTLKSNNIISKVEAEDECL